MYAKTKDSAARAGANRARYGWTSSAVHMHNTHSVHVNQVDQIDHSSVMLHEPRGMS